MYPGQHAITTSPSMKWAEGPTEVYTHKVFFFWRSHSKWLKKVCSPTKPTLWTAFPQNYRNFQTQFLTISLPQCMLQQLDTQLQLHCHTATHPLKVQTKISGLKSQFIVWTRMGKVWYSSSRFHLTSLFSTKEARYLMTLGWFSCCTEKKLIRGWKFIRVQMCGG